MSNFTSSSSVPSKYAYARVCRVVSLIYSALAGKKQIRFVMAGLLFLLVSSMGNKAFAFGTTYYYPTSVTAGGGGTYCVGSTATGLTGTINDGSSTATGGTSSTVTWTWYYNTTGATGTTAGATSVLTGGPYTAGSGSTSAPLPSANISTATPGTYYYFLCVNYAGGTYGSGSLFSNLITVTVNSTLPITGTTTICQGSTTTLGDATPGGTWSSTVPGVATVTSGGGLVTGISGGLTSIVYSAGCGAPATITVSVTAIPSAITGPGAVCIGNTITLSDSPFGAWGSSNTSVATVAPTTGVVSGLTSGTTNITYSNGCGTPASTIITVNPLPPSITGPDSLCPGGATITLNDATTGGTWSSSMPTVAAAGLVTGVITSGLSGTTTITYTSPLTCITTKVVTVEPLPAPIGGILHECAGTQVTLTNTTIGGTWVSSTPPVASIDTNSGLVTGVSGGTTVITYITACGSITAIDTSIAAPDPIVGNGSVCLGSATTFADIPTGGTWTSSTPGTASVLSGSGVITGVTVGTATITYTIPPGCSAIKSVNVVALPPAISGVKHTCIGMTTTLNDAFTGGTWSSLQTYVASVNDASGIVTGVTADTANIVYTDAAGCKTSTTVTVNPSPDSIVTGFIANCSSTMDTMYDATPGGAWSSGATAVATISAAGVVTTLTGGTAIITYKLPTGCLVSKSFSVHPLPSPIVTWDWATNTFFTNNIYVTYQWYDSIQGQINGANAFQTAALYNGYYWVVVTDTNGCTAASGHVHYNTNMTGVPTVNSGTVLRIYPNPANGVVYIESGIRVRAVIRGIDGKTELEEVDAKQLDISRLANGIYFISLYADSGQRLIVEKLIKQ